MQKPVSRRRPGVRHRAVLGVLPAATLATLVSMSLADAGMNVSVFLCLLFRVDV